MSALSKGFGILDKIAGSGAGLSFSEVVDETGMPKASVHRLLRELVDLSALVYDDETRRYRGGLLLARLGASVTENFDIRRTVRPYLEALHEKTGSVATLGIRDGLQGVYIDKIEPVGLVIRLHSEIGKSFPLHCTAIGKVLLSQSDAETINKLTRRKLQRYTPNTITEGRKLRDELTVVAANGFAVDREEITRGLVCVGAPIYGITGQIAAAISCTFSSFDADSRKLDEITGFVIDCARSASAAEPA